MVDQVSFLKEKLVLSFINDAMASSIASLAFLLDPYLFMTKIIHSFHKFSSINIEVFFFPISTVKTITVLLSIKIPYIILAVITVNLIIYYRQRYNCKVVSK